MIIENQKILEVCSKSTGFDILRIEERENCFIYSYSHFWWFEKRFRTTKEEFYIMTQNIEKIDLIIKNKEKELNYLKKLTKKWKENK